MFCQKQRIWARYRRYYLTGLAKRPMSSGMSSLPPPPGQGQNHQLIDREEELFVGVTPEGDIKPEERRAHLWEEFALMTRRFIQENNVAVSETPPQESVSDVYRSILSDCLLGRQYEFRHATREFDAFGDEQLSLSDGWRVVTKKRTATFSQLERRGLAIYGLEIDRDFEEGIMKTLVYSSQGKIKLRLTRDLDKYGAMTTKGFKVGTFCSLRVHSTDNVQDTHIDSSCPYRADASVTYIDTRSVELELRQPGLPQFLNALVAHKGAHELYLCVDMGGLKRDEDQLNKLKKEMKQPLRVRPGGALDYILTQWTNPTPRVDEEKVKEEKEVKPRSSTSNVRSKRKKKRSQNKALYDALKSSSKNQSRQLLDEYKIKLYNKRIEHEETMVKALIESLKMVNTDETGVTIIHGPPGTGKSTITAEIVLQLMMKKPKWRILVLAPSHAATDNILASMSRWIDEKDKFYRHGDHSKITDDYVREHHSLGTQEVDQRTKAVIESASSEQFASEATYEEFINQRVTRTLNHAQWQMRRKLRDIESGAQVHCAVLGAAQNEKSKFGASILAGKYDLAIIDEAGFAELSDTLMMLKPFKKLIIAGDHLQLPPVVKTDEAKELGLQKSFMEHLVERLPSRHFMLDTQFRSNYDISEWSSKVLYDGRLRPHANNKSINLGDLCQSGHELLLNRGLIWFDTSGFGMKEGVDSSPEYHESANNPGEAEMVRIIYSYLIDQMGLKNEQIGVIAPHWAQTATIRSEFEAAGLDHRSVELRTIDGYQGREKEVIIVSMVRANDKYNVGLFEDIRRMNVAITRAKRLCILIGESTTFKYEEDYERLFTGLKSSQRLLGIAQFNKMFGATIKPNDEHKRAQREEEAWSRWEQGLL